MSGQLATFVALMLVTNWQYVKHDLTCTVNRQQKMFSFNTKCIVSLLKTKEHDKYTFNHVLHIQLTKHNVIYEKQKGDKLRFVRKMVGIIEHQEFTVKT